MSTPSLDELTQKIMAVVSYRLENHEDLSAQEIAQMSSAVKAMKGESRLTRAEEDEQFSRMGIEERAAIFLLFVEREPLNKQQLLVISDACQRRIGEIEKREAIKEADRQ